MIFVDLLLMIYNSLVLLICCEGVLLYSYDGNLKGDFLSVNLIDSSVQFRFNLGSGSANIV